MKQQPKILNEFILEIKKFGLKKAAIKSKVSLRTIEKWVQGKRVPNLITAQKVANAMHLEFLIFDMED